MNMIVFKEISEFPGYRVGDDGSVWSCRSRNGKTGFGEWRTLKVSVSKSGHLYVKLQLGKRRIRSHRWVHRLILESFVGPCPEGMVCRHFPDRNPANNCLGNLQWGTHAENCADTFLHGMACVGERNGNCKLSAKSVALIREAILNGVPQARIATGFGISQPTVSNINTGRRRAYD